MVDRPVLYVGIAAPLVEAASVWEVAVEQGGDPEQLEALKASFPGDRLLDAILPRPDVLFLAACHSGAVLDRARASVHWPTGAIVSIERTAAVEVSACVEFEAMFFGALLRGDTAGAAWDAAWAFVESNPSLGPRSVAPGKLAPSDKFRINPSGREVRLVPRASAPGGVPAGQLRPKPPRQSRLSRRSSGRFVGRRREMAGVVEALLPLVAGTHHAPGAKDRRLVTLTKEGGIGKTAIACEVSDWAYERRAFPAGVFAMLPPMLQFARSKYQPADEADWEAAWIKFWEEQVGVWSDGISGRLLDGIEVAAADRRVIAEGAHQTAKLLFGRMQANWQAVYDHLILMNAPLAKGLLLNVVAFCQLSGQLVVLRELATRGVAALRHFGREEDVAPCLGTLGNVQRDLGEREAARESFLEALELYWPLVEKWPAAFAGDFRVALRNYVEGTPEDAADPWWGIGRGLSSGS